MSIIITEEDLCKKHAKKCAKICQFSSLPSKWIQAVNDPNTKIDSKPHICAYNYNTRTGFRDHKKTWGPRVLSSTLVWSHWSPRGFADTAHCGDTQTKPCHQDNILITSICSTVFYCHTEPLLFYAKKSQICKTRSPTNMFKNGIG